MMKNTETFTLIDRHFSYDDAEETLLEMFSSKINYHKIKNWSSQERFGKDDEIAQIKIPELKKELEKLQTLLSKAKNNGKEIDITSEIKITLLER